MCMCGILAAEYETLPEPMRTAVIQFFDENQKWLADLLKQGQTDNTLSFTGSADDVAQSILSTLEGAMLVARPYGDLAKFNRRPTGYWPASPDNKQRPATRRSRLRTVGCITTGRRSVLIRDVDALRRQVLGEL